MTHNQPDDLEPSLIDIMAHDLKTPIGAVKGFLEMIQRVGTLNDQQTIFAGKAQKALFRMEIMINDLLEYSRLESGWTLRQESVDLREAVNDACDLVYALVQSREVKLHITVEDGANRVIGDAGLLQQALNNLISNAVKYNRHGGDVWVSLRRQRGQIRGDVRDNGDGIAPEDQARIFDRFYRAKTGQEREGSGLGLAITRMIIERHQGQLWLESVPGQGATFSFILPLATQGENTRTANYTGGGGEHSDGLDDRYQDAPELVDSDAREEEM